MKNILSIILFVVTLQAVAQQTNESVLNHEDYLANPSNYLSELTDEIVGSEVLIDRCYHGDELFNTNGTTAVTCISPSQFEDSYYSLKYSHSDTTSMIPYDTLAMLARNAYQVEGVIPIAINDFEFKKIDSTALINEELVQEEGRLRTRSISPTTFTTHRTFQASTFNYNVTGDDLKFVVHNFFKSTNLKNQQVESIQVDFDNGEGYQEVTMNEVKNVHYSSESRFHEIKVKMTTKDTTTATRSTVYAHTAIHRTGTSTVPNPDESFYLPPPVIGDWYCDCYNTDRDECEEMYKKPQLYSDCKRNILYKPHTFHISIYHSPNTIGVLRKPFIVTDGFDHGNNRNFRESYYSSDDLPKDRDGRGIYQFVNGDPSPWYIGRYKSANLIPELQKRGYDIVIVNFLSGSGDIKKNGDKFIEFLDLLNNRYRDERTEEAVIVGPSMGGQITRYALTKMEKEGKYHYVKDWIAFDSPNKGANIPLSLQYALQALRDVKKSAVDGKIAKLNSPAAKQMLMYHFSNYPQKNSDHINEYNQYYTRIASLGYPEQSRNHAISNGGVRPIYEISPKVKTIMMKIGLGTIVYGWPITGYYAGLITKKLPALPGGRHREYYSKITLPLDNCLGGWNSALYSLNFNKKNYNRNIGSLRDSNPVFTKATFMPTASTFGVEVNQNTINKNWKQFAPIGKAKNGKIETPFDVLYGAPRDCEEHVTILSHTRNHITKELDKYFKDFSKPYNGRPNQPVTVKVDKPVLYRAEQSITLGGNGNKFIAQNGATVTAEAGQSITLLPSTEIQRGASFIAETKTVRNTASGARVAIQTTKPVDYTQTSPYLGKKYSYAKAAPNDEQPVFKGYELHIYPNPTKGVVRFHVPEQLAIAPVKVEVVNIQGAILDEKPLRKGNDHLVDLSSLPTGVYFLRFVSENQVLDVKKVIKN